MRFEHILIGFIILSLFVIGGTLMIQDMDGSYDDVNMSDADDDFSDVYNTIEDMHSLGAEAKNKSLDEDISETDSWESMTKGSYSALRLVPQTFSLYHAISRAIGNTLGISCSKEGIADSAACPFIDAAFYAFVISVAFSVVYMIFRFIPR